MHNLEWNDQPMYAMTRSQCQHRPIYYITKIPYYTLPLRLRSLICTFFVTSSNKEFIIYQHQAGPKRLCLAMPFYYGYLRNGPLQKVFSTPARGGRDMALILRDC